MKKLTMIVVTSILAQRNARIQIVEELANTIILLSMTHIYVGKLNVFTNACFVTDNVYSLIICIRNSLREEIMPR